MDHAALGPDLIGRRVRILAWADYAELFRYFARRGAMPPEPVGTVTGVGDYGAGHLEVQVRIAEYPRPFVYEAHQLELLA